MHAPARRRGWRWVKRGALGLVALVGVAVVAALVALHTPWGQRQVRAQVEQRLRSAFTGGASLGSVQGSPFGELRLGGLVINGPDGKPAISIKKLRVEVGILPLLSHQVRVAGVEAEDVDVDLRRDPDGELQIKRLTRPGPKSTWSIALPRIALRRAHVRFDAGREVMNFDGLTFDGRAKLPYGGPIDASFELTGTWRERRAAPLDVQTVVRAEQGRLSVPYLTVRAGDVSILGSHLLVVSTPGVTAPAISGALIVDASAAGVARLAPEVRLPGDLALTITATQSETPPWTELAIAGTVDRSPVRFVGAADLGGKHLRGELGTGALDLGKLSRGKVAGTAAGRAVLDVRPGGARALPVASATVHGWAQLRGAPRTTFDVALHAAGERARATIEAIGEGVNARLAARVHTVGERLAIESATLRAFTADPARASGGKAPVRGALRVNLSAQGEVRPRPDLAVTGTVEGRRLRSRGVSARLLHVSLDATHLPNRPFGKAHVHVVDLVRNELQLGALTVDAADRADGRLAVQVRSRPKQSPWLLDADALVTPPAMAGPGTFVIDLLDHHIRAGSGQDWTGRGGHLRIAPARIELRDLATASEAGRLAVSGRYERAGRRRGDLAATLDATRLSLDNLAGKYHGNVDTRVAVSRRNGRWQGDARIDATGLAVDPSSTMLDAHATAALHDGRLEVAANAASLGIGSARLAIDLDAPAAIEQPAAWKRLGRDAIRDGRLTLEGIDLRRAAELAGLPGEYGGRLSGDLLVSATATGGRLEARDLLAPALRGLPGVSAVLDLAPGGPDEVTPTLTLAADGIGRVYAQADLEVPDRLFDPAAWRRLGRGALRAASVTAEELVIEPATLHRFGIDRTLRGRVSFVVDVGEAARTIQAKLDVCGVRGAPIQQPVDLQLAAKTDERATTSTVVVQSLGTPLLELEARIPGSVMDLIDRRRVNPAAVRAVPVTAAVKLDRVAAPRLLAVFGRTEVIGGVLDGAVEVAGTLGEPIAKVRLVATGLQVPPGPRGKPVRTVERLTIDGTWDGDTARLDVNSTESMGGRLELTGVARPAALHEGRLSLEATKFDLLPILAFLPGPAGGAAGHLDANVRLTGLDLRTTKLDGELHVVDGRFPIAPAVGTLRRAKLDAVVANREIRLSLDGRLGRGSIDLEGAIALDGLTPRSGNAKIILSKVSPIGNIEPEVSANITAKLAREQQRWLADLVVDDAKVVVPKDRGETLKPVGAPPDMVFGIGPQVARQPAIRALPDAPVFVVKLALRSTQVESEEFRGLIKGRLELRAGGGVVGIVGEIAADRGELDLFGHRYFVERAAVSFDGSLDPLLDVRMTHDFPEVTTITEIRGRASDPELLLSSDPATYSQGQLLGFLLGGEPGGAPESAPDRAAAAGASFVANRLGGYVRGALPLDIDVLRYEASTSTSSAAILVGTWITHSLFLAYRQHLEARPDENTGEGQGEYWISRRVVVEGTVGNRGYNSLDLLWRLRY